MLIILMSIYDKITEKFGVPFTVETVGEAVRQYQHMVLDESTLFHSHPDCYELYIIGMYNIKEGTISNDGCPHKVDVDISEFKR